MKIWTWDDETAKKVLKQRLHEAQEDRKRREHTWRRNERTVFETEGQSLADNNLSVSVDSDGTSAGPESSIGTNYVMKNIRFMQAQMSANPPSVAFRASTSDPEDRKAADAADRIARWGLRAYKLHEMSDRRNLNTLIYGTGFTKERWNPHAGSLLHVDEDTGEFITEGDYEIYIPDVWNIFLDADASNEEEIRYVFEKIYVPWEEAKNRWPEHVDMLKAFRLKQERKSTEAGQGSALRKTVYDMVPLYEYWEKGLPINGYQGRFAIHTADGDLLDYGINPERYRPVSPTYKELQLKLKEKTLPIAKAFLPYTILTDIDEPNTPWGKSTVEFASLMQSTLNQLDSTILESVQAHGIPRMILPEGSEIADGSISNSPWDVIKITGTQPPHFMEPMPLPPAVTQLRESFRMGIDDMQGINESMFGQQSREQSGFAAQYATNQGNMIRQRMFNKFVFVSEATYKRLVLIAANRWATSRTIQVIGKENALETSAFKGADIAHGYDAVAEFGTTLSLDPITRRGELMNMMPLLEKAEMDPSTILSLMKIGDTGLAMDLVGLAEARQSVYFDYIIKTGMQKEPRQKEDHARMLVYASKFVMMRAYQDLDDTIKELIDDHIDARQALIVQPPAPGGIELPPGAAPGAPPPPGESPPEEAGPEITNF